MPVSLTSVSPPDSALSLAHAQAVNATLVVAAGVGVDVLGRAVQGDRGCIFEAEAGSPLVAQVGLPCKVPV